MSNGNGKSIIDESPRGIAEQQRKEMIEAVIHIEAIQLLPIVVSTGALLTPEEIAERAVAIARAMDVRARAAKIERQVAPPAGSGLPGGGNLPPGMRFPGR